MSARAAARKNIKTKAATGYLGMGVAEDNRCRPPEFVGSGVDQRTIAELLPVSGRWMLL